MLSGVWCETMRCVSTPHPNDKPKWKQKGFSLRAKESPGTIRTLRVALISSRVGRLNRWWCGGMSQERNDRLFQVEAATLGHCVLGVASRAVYNIVIIIRLPPLIREVTSPASSLHTYRVLRISHYSVYELSTSIVIDIYRRCTRHSFVKDS